MTLDEAIKHAEEVAEEQEKAATEWHENQVRKCELIRFAEMDYTHENECKKCAKENRQLAEWLKDYKRLLEQQQLEKLKQVEQIVNDWNNDASHSFSDMCKINEIIKKGRMGRRFKDVNVNQLNELIHKLNEKIKASCLKDALLFSQAYAAAEELKDIKEKGPLFNWTDIKASDPPEERGILCVDLDGDIWMAHYSKISKGWYADGYGDRLKNIVAWMEVPDYKGRKREINE